MLHLTLRLNSQIRYFSSLVVPWIALGSFTPGADWRFLVRIASQPVVLIELFLFSVLRHNGVHDMARRQCLNLNIAKAQ